MPKAKEALQVLAPNFRALTLTLNSTSPGLIVHRFAEKAKKEMLDKMMATSRVKKKRAPKDPQAEFIGSLYLLDKKGERYDATAIPKKLTPEMRYGFPANGFKKAMVSACRVTEGLSMAEAKQLFFVVGDVGDLIEIKSKKMPQMAEDVVRVSMSTDIRYRGWFPEWTAGLRIEYDADRVTTEDIVNLLRKAGMQVGIGERRPEKEGNTYGRWTVSDKGIKDEAI